MAKRVIGKLSARKVETVKESGRYSDGGQLYLDVSSDGRRRWLFLFAHGVTSAGKPRRVEMGLGSARDVGLAEARELAEQARRDLRAGLNPLEERRKREREASPATFGDVADAYIKDAIAPALRNAKAVEQWRTTLGTERFDERRIRTDRKAHAAYARALATVRAKPVSNVAVEDVLAILSPIWRAAPETASRIRGRIERVLDAARAKGLRTGENPARWRGHLDHLLPARQRLTRGHHAAVPYSEIPAFMRAMEGRDDVSYQLLRFIVLTASRTGEARGAAWGEFDLERGIWTVPAARMKAGREHRVPLVPQVVELIESMRPLRASDAPDAIVFPGVGGKATSSMTPAMALRRLASAWEGEGPAPWADTTIHGFRSAFRDWCGEETSFPREIAEAALAHTVGDATERAYRRGDALERRRELMAAWAGFCLAPAGGNVVQIRRSARAE